MTDETSPKKTGDTSSEWAKRRARIEADGAYEVLQIFGFDIDDVHEMQKDILYLRRLRTMHEAVGAKAILGVVGLFFAALGVAFKLIWDKLTNGQ